MLPYEVNVRLQDKAGNIYLKYDSSLPLPRLNEVIIHKNECYDVTGVGHDHNARKILIYAKFI
jgi:hypothetical protein